MRRRYVVLCKARQEERAARAIKAQGLVSFVPMRTEWERDGRQLKPVAVPMFERYVFVAVDASQKSHANAWGRIKSAPGVIRVLCNVAGEPQPVRPKIMRDLQRAHRNREKRPKRVQLLYKPGDHVRLCDWAWSGREGIVMGYERAKVRVLVGLMMPLVKEEDLERIEKVNDAPPRGWRR